MLTFLFTSHWKLWGLYDFFLVLLFIFFYSILFHNWLKVLRQSRRYWLWRIGSIKKSRLWLNLLFLFFTLLFNDFFLGSGSFIYLLILRYNWCRLLYFNDFLHSFCVSFLWYCVTWNFPRWKHPLSMLLYYILDKNLSLLVLSIFPRSLRD